MDHIGAFWKGGIREPITAPVANGGAIRIRCILELVIMTSISELEDLVEQCFRRIAVLSERIDSLERDLGDLTETVAQHLESLFL